MGIQPEVFQPFPEVHHIAEACVQTFPQTTHGSRHWRSRYADEHTHGPGAPVFHCPPGVREGRMAARLSPLNSGSTLGSEGGHATQ